MSSSLAYRAIPEPILPASRSSRTAARLDLRSRRLLEWPDARRQIHFTLMPAALITLPIFSVSLARNLPNSSGDIDNGTPPRSSSRAFILGSARAAFTSLLSVAMIAAGVTGGGPAAYHRADSDPGHGPPH